MKLIISFIYIYSIITISYSNPETDENVMNEFTLKFYEKAVKRNPEKNLVLSPVSVQVLLGLLAFGARDNTQKEIFDTLKTDDLNTIESKFKSLLTRLNKKDGGTLKMANKIYMKKDDAYTPHPDFKRTAVNSFLSDVENVDFSQKKQTADNINGWVEEKTDGKIKNFVDPNSLNGAIVMNLINAIYFQGNWKTQFDERFSFNGKFKKNNNTEVPQKMMRIRGRFPYAILPELDSHIVGFPYKINNTQLLIILPNKIDGLAELEGKISELNINDLQRKLVVVMAQIEIPKFKIETSIDLINILKDVGLQKMFDLTESNFNGLLKTTGARLYVGKAEQKAFIEIDEHGTEAAAATEIRFVLMGIMRNVFIANHPFLYLLVNNDDILFCGRYIGP